MAGWQKLRELVREEIIQRTEEGCDTHGFQERWEQAVSDSELMLIYDDLSKLPIRPDFPYVEPSHLAGIKALKQTSSHCWDVKVDDALRSKVMGAWLGRIAGCNLGKPVEGWSREQICTFLRSVGEYPLRDYIPPTPDPLPSGVTKATHPGMSRGQWSHAMVDDDTNYTVLGLKIIEQLGPGFTTADVGRLWLQDLPYFAVCTAERQAYLNLVNEVPIELVSTYINPYREWIGAQIRADFFGYCAPGLPEKAADMAYRDAALSHVKNGIYGEMFCAAAISAAFATNDIYEIIAAAANEIPTTSRLAETIRDCLRWRKECATWADAFDSMLDTYYGKYNWVHTNNNLAIVLIALLYGWPSFEDVICISVMQGMDTDCNGATAGSIVGAAFGADAVPEKWSKPLGGRLQTTVIGFPLPEIAELADRTMVQIRKVLS
jgi:ADP-ribosylglycohydrolase